MSLLRWIFGEPPRPPPLDLCHDCGPHDDDLVDKTTMRSGYDQMDDRSKRDLIDNVCDPNDVQGYFVRKVIFTFKCKKCGRVKQETHINPEPE